jgi:VCBS repeat-containing protein
LSDTVTVATSGGTEQTITVTINGADDAAVVTGNDTGAVTEDSGTNATGDLDHTDVDGDDVDDAWNTAVVTQGSYGTLTIGADGQWSYDLDDTNATVNALDAGDTLSDTVTVATSGGTEQTITITINGADDAADDSTSVSILAIDADTGDSNLDFLTRDNTLVFSGTAEAGASVEVSLNNNVLGTSSTQASGAWLFDHTSIGLLDGVYTLSVKATDAASNTATDTRTLTIDTTATITIDVVAGNDEIDASEDDADVTISGTVTGVEDGREVTVSLNGKSYTGTVSANVWSIQISATDAQALDQNETVQASVVDLAGNSASIARAITHEIENVILRDDNGDGSIFGTNTDDKIRGDDSGLMVSGGGGKDDIEVGNGRNLINAGDGDDTVKSGNAADRIDGGRGNDTLDAGGGSNVAIDLYGSNVITADSGDDQIITGMGNDQIDAGAGNNRVTSRGGDNDILTGDGADIVLTGNGNDTIFTGGGSDRITAGGGNDTIRAGAGNDMISGGGGEDIFIFEGGGGFDRVMDFQLGVDTFAFDIGTFSGVNSYDDLVIRDFGRLAIIQAEDTTIYARLIGSGGLDIDDFAFV